MTQLFHLDPLHIDPHAIQTAAVALREGQTVAFPTETVYGLGGNALDPQAVKRIFAAKGRPSDNPLIVHIAALDKLDSIVSSVPPIAEQLMRQFWPGPLTMVLPRAASIPDVVTAGLDTVAVRMPDHPVALALIAASGVPVAAPSANRSGRPSPTRAEHVVEDLWGKVDVILDAGPCAVGVESTVLDVTCDPPMILRPGGVTREMIEDALGVIIAVDPAIATHAQLQSLVPSPQSLVGDEKLSADHGENQSSSDRGACRGAAQPRPGCPSSPDPSIPTLGTRDSGLGTCQDFAPRSPGMKYTHYAPKAPMTLYVGPRDAVVGAIAERAAAETATGHKVGVMLTSPVPFMPGDVVIQLTESTDHRPQSTETDQEQGQRSKGQGAETCGPSCWLRRNPHLDWLQTNSTHAPGAYSPEELQTIANGIYDALRRFDEEGVDLILAQGVPETGLGQAIMNRLSKAAGGNVMRVGRETIS